MSTTSPVNKRRLIQDHVAGKSFVDIGGLWGTKGEMVTTAAAGGAERLMMADIQAPGNTWWQKFEARCAEKGVDNCEQLQVDICAPDAPSRLGQFDVVHCAGVMYHVADLFQFVGNLVSVTREHLVLSSVVMPDEIQGPAGALSFGPDHAYLAPVLSEQNRNVVLGHLRAHDLKAAGLTDSAAYFDQGRTRFGPWWWLFSGTFMSALVRLHGLDVIAEGPSRGGHAYTVFAKVAADTHRA